MDDLVSYINNPKINSRHTSLQLTSKLMTSHKKNNTGKGKKNKSGKGNKRMDEEEAFIDKFKRNLDIQSVPKHRVTKIDISLSKDWFNNILNK